MIYLVFYINLICLSDHSLKKSGVKQFYSRVFLISKFSLTVNGQSCVGGEESRPSSVLRWLGPIYELDSLQRTRGVGDNMTSAGSGPVSLTAADEENECGQTRLHPV